MHCFLFLSPFSSLCAASFYVYTYICIYMYVYIYVKKKQLSSSSLLIWSSALFFFFAFFSPSHTLLFPCLLLLLLPYPGLFPLLSTYCGTRLFINTFINMCATICIESLPGLLLRTVPSVFSLSLSLSLSLSVCMRMCVCAVESDLVYE